MSALRLSYRAPRYLDRTIALETGEVAPAGVELEYLVVDSIGGSARAVEEGDVDLAEVLLGEYVQRVAAGDDRLVAIPVFPARRFPHRFLFVRAESEMHSLESLAGRRIAAPRRAASGAVWVRHLLARRSVEARFSQGRLGGKLADRLDGPLSDEELAEPTLAQQLERGEIDCLLTPYKLPADEGGAQLRSLLADPAAAERDEIRSGGIFPISNVVVLRREMCRRHPWLPETLLDAFTEAKELGIRRLNYLGALAVSLPWLSTMLEEIDELFGGDAYPYGVARNRATLEAFSMFALAQGLAEREVSVEELFAAQVLHHPGVPDTTHYDVPMRGTR
jgi:4,5-dihydroxyphthalate decarboxylase